LIIRLAFLVLTYSNYKKGMFTITWIRKPLTSKDTFPPMTILFQLTCGIWWYAKIALISAPNGWVKTQFTNWAGVMWWYASYMKSDRTVMFSPPFIAYLRIWWHTFNAGHIHFSTEQRPHTQLLHTQLLLGQNMKNQLPPFKQQQFTLLFSKMGKYIICLEYSCQPVWTVGSSTSW